MNKPLFEIEPPPRTTNIEAGHQQPNNKKPDIKTKRRFETRKMFHAVTSKHLSLSEYAVWNVLWDAATIIDEQNVATIGQKLIVEQLPISHSTVKRTIKSLIDKGLIVRLTRGNNLKHQVSTYIVYSVPKGEK